MADMTKEIYDKVIKRYLEIETSERKKNTKIDRLFLSVDSGKSIGIAKTQEYAGYVGKFMSQALNDVLSADVVIDEAGIYQSLVQTVVGDSLKYNYDVVSEIALDAQTNMLKSQGIGMKSVKPAINTEQVNSISESVAKNFEHLTNELKAVETFAIKVIDESIEQNIRMHEKAGLNTIVKRTYDGVGVHNRKDKCQFCLSRCGTFTVEEARSNDVFRRHEGCGCIIEYLTTKYKLTKSTSKFSGWT